MEFFHDSPESKGLPSNIKKVQTTENTADYNEAQKQVLLMPAIWILALSSAFMYISRYAVNSWGVFILKHKRL